MTYRGQPASIGAPRGVAKDAVAAAAGDTSDGTAVDADDVDVGAPGQVGVRMPVGGEGDLAPVRAEHRRLVPAGAASQPAHHARGHIGQPQLWRLLVDVAL